MLRTVVLLLRQRLIKQRGEAIAAVLAVVRSVSICTFVPIKQVKWVAPVVQRAHAHLRQGRVGATFVPVPQVNCTFVPVMQVN